MSIKVTPATTAICKCALHNSTPLQLHSRYCNKCPHLVIDDQAQSGTGTGSALRIAALHCQYHSSNAPYSIHSSIYSFICCRVYSVFRKSQHRWTKHLTHPLCLYITHTHARKHTHIYVYIHTYIHVHTYMDTYIYIYIHTHTYIHTYIRT